MIDPLFQFHQLNEQGIVKAQRIAELFTELLFELRTCCDPHPSDGYGREFNIVRTKLEEACFFAKKVVAVNPGNQR